MTHVTENPLIQPEVPSMDLNHRYWLEPQVFEKCHAAQDFAANTQWCVDTLASLLRCKESNTWIVFLLMLAAYSLLTTYIVWRVSDRANNHRCYQVLKQDAEPVLSSKTVSGPGCTTPTPAREDVQVDSWRNSGGLTKPAYSEATKIGALYGT
jgi:hypothetical protein